MTVPPNPIGPRTQRASSAPHVTPQTRANPSRGWRAAASASGSTRPGLLDSGIQPLHAPDIGIGLHPRPAETIMQAKIAIGPELDFDRPDAESYPMRRARRFGRVFGSQFRDLGQKRSAGRERARLFRGPGADPALIGARMVIGVSLRVRDLL